MGTVHPRRTTGTSRDAAGDFLGRVLAPAGRVLLGESGGLYLVGRVEFLPPCARVAAFTAGEVGSWQEVRRKFGRVTPGGAEMRALPSGRLRQVAAPLHYLFRRSSALF